LLLASLFFYASWNFNYTFLILTTIVSTYFAGSLLARAKSRVGRQGTVAMVLIINFGILVMFKYYNFLAGSANSLLGQLRADLQFSYLDFLLPVGISFYTFQAMGYVIDVYRDARNRTTNLGEFALYISFFPQLVAGPIERSWRLLPQLRQRAEFDLERFNSGLLLALWGFFKKLVIADRLALYTDSVFAVPAEFSGLQLLLGTYLFAFQIYCDFSGYSDIAIGLARVLGVDLMLNFNRPYLAKSIQDFWRRWHISLSTWFRDYLYIPLGGSRKGTPRLLFNLLFVFLVCGLWHGANWTFVLWGGAHGVLLCLQHVIADKAPWSGLGEKLLGARLCLFMQVFLTFNVVSLLWVFFRSQTITDAMLILEKIVMETRFVGNVFANTGMNPYEFSVGISAVALMMLYELFSKGREFDAFAMSGGKAGAWGASYALLASIMVFGVFNLNEFIYFQF